MASLINSKTSEILQDYMKTDQSKNEKLAIKEIILTNSLGANVAQTGKTTDYNQSDENWWVLAKSKGVYIDKSFDESVGSNSIDISLRIADDTGKFLGIMKIVMVIN